MMFYDYILGLYKRDFLELLCFYQGWEGEQSKWVSTLKIEETSHRQQSTLAGFSR